MLIPQIETPLTPDLLLAAGIPLIVAAVGYGVLRQRVDQHDKALTEKADKAVVDAHLAHIDKRFDTVEQKLDRLSEHLLKPHREP